MPFCRTSNSLPIVLNNRPRQSWNSREALPTVSNTAVRIDLVRSLLSRIHLLTTLLPFRFFVASFAVGGYSFAVPSHAEMQLLVDLALNDDDLQSAIAEYYPFVRRAEYVRDDADDSGSNDGPPAGVTPPVPAQDGNAVSPLLNDNIFTGEGNDTDDSTDQFIIIVASACAAGLVFCLLMGYLFYLHQQRRKSFWREDAAHINNNAIINKGEDAASEDLEGAKNTKRRGRSSMRGHDKEKSLHLRDSLQERHDFETVQLPTWQSTSQSDAGSSRLGGVLSSAAAAMLPALGDSDIERPGVVHRKRSNSTSSCSRSEEDSLPQPDNKQYQEAVIADDLTCPSDFEGNAIIRPNLVPVPTNVDRYNDNNEVHDIMHEPLPPPSRTASARRDELPISIGRVNSASHTTDAFTTPTKSRVRSSSHEGGGFMAKYIHPIAGSVSLPYFGGSFDGATGNGNADSDNKKNISPHTHATTPDTDARWSDISSELDIDLGNKTDDEFDNDDNWDPDDASITSSQCEKDAFSPMKATKNNDETRLLKSTEGLKYNLGKIRASSPYTVGSRDASPQRTVQARETLLV